MFLFIINSYAFLKIILLEKCILNNIFMKTLFCVTFKNKFSPKDILFPLIFRESARGGGKGKREREREQEREIVSWARIRSAKAQTLDQKLNLRALGLWADALTTELRPARTCLIFFIYYGTSKDLWVQCSSKNFLFSLSLQFEWSFNHLPGPHSLRFWFKRPRVGVRICMSNRFSWIIIDFNLSNLIILPFNLVRLNHHEAAISPLFRRS